MAKINIQQLDRYETEYKSYEKINKKNGKNKSQDGENIFQSPGKLDRRRTDNDY
jgi:hypothetical protein